MEKNVLIIDDEYSKRYKPLMFKEKGFNICDYIENPEEKDPIKCIRAAKPEIVVVDALFGTQSLGGDICKVIRATNDSLPIIIYTANLDTKKLNDLKAYFGLADLPGIELIPKREDHVKLFKAMERMLSGVVQNKDFKYEKIDFVIGNTPEMKKVETQIQNLKIKAARVGRLTVLILGDSGTGKELAARAIHKLSTTENSKTPIKVDCGLIPSKIAESELFGSVKGAFNDAPDRPGPFEIAKGGTVFLDEIGEMDYNIQHKLLTVIQDRVLCRVGSTKEIKVDANIICATNQKIGSEDSEKQFRNDLYHRIGRDVIKLPSLNQRKDDIPALFKYFIKKLNKKWGEEIEDVLNDEAAKELMAYDWKIGNIRDLENVISRAFETLVLENERNSTDKCFIKDFDLSIKPEDSSSNDYNDNEEINLFSESGIELLMTKLLNGKIKFPGLSELTDEHGPPVAKKIVKRLWAKERSLRIVGEKLGFYEPIKKGDTQKEKAAKRKLERKFQGFAKNSLGLRTPK
jgi:DNA-binding NtrC family response regulator